MQGCCSPRMMMISRPYQSLTQRVLEGLGSSPQFTAATQFSKAIAWFLRARRIRKGAVRRWSSPRLNYSHVIPCARQRKCTAPELKRPPIEAANAD